MCALAASDVRSFLDEGPRFCFTTDIEWSPEWAIQATFELADRYGVAITPFLTHRSEFLSRRLVDPVLRRNAGIHPNFLAGSTHGATMDEVVEHTMALLPGAISFRAHCFYDDTRIHQRFADLGFRYDSNTCAFLQPALVPMRTATTILRFPVFWEDDLHSASGLAWDLDALSGDLTSPGLKIFNVHPLRVALNVPDEAAYERARAFREQTSPGTAYGGAGTRTLFEDLLRFATTAGRRAVGLDELYDDAVERGFAVPPSERRDVAEVPDPERVDEPV